MDYCPDQCLGSFTSPTILLKRAYHWSMDLSNVDVAKKHPAKRPEPALIQTPDYAALLKSERVRLKIENSKVWIHPVLKSNMRAAEAGESRQLRCQLRDAGTRRRT